MGSYSIICDQIFKGSQAGQSWFVVKMVGAEFMQNLESAVLMSLLFVTITEQVKTLSRLDLHKKKSCRGFTYGCIFVQYRDS